MYANRIRIQILKPKNEAAPTQSSYGRAWFKTSNRTVEISTVWTDQYISRPTSFTHKMGPKSLCSYTSIYGSSYSLSTKTVLAYFNKE